MYTKNHKSRFLFIAVLSGALMTGGLALAGEKELMVSSSEMIFSLQAQVQTALDLQIEQKASGTLGRYEAAQPFKQIPVINTKDIEKNSKAGDSEEVICLGTQEMVKCAQMPLFSLK